MYLHDENYFIFFLKKDIQLFCENFPIKDKEFINLLAEHFIEKNIFQIGSYKKKTNNNLNIESTVITEGPGNLILKVDNTNVINNYTISLKFIIDIIDNSTEHYKKITTAFNLQKEKKFFLVSKIQQDSYININDKIQIPYHWFFYQNNLNIYEVLNDIKAYNLLNIIFN